MRCLSLPLLGIGIDGEKNTSIDVGLLIVNVFKADENICLKICTQTKRIKVTRLYALCIAVYLCCNVDFMQKNK